MTLRHSGRVFIVTGGLGGIGFSTARMLLAQGARIAIADRSEPSMAQRALLDGDARSHIAIQCDVTSRADVQATVNRTLDAFGRIDGLVNSAGVDRRTPLFDITDEAFGEIIDVNVLGSFRFAQVVARVMARQGVPESGSYSIVHLSSVNAVIGSATHTEYAATKGAIAQMTRVMAVELAPHGIRVNAVGPGTIRTEMLDRWVEANPRALDGVHARTPLKRVGEPGEVAAVISFLLSNEASYVTGQTYYVDGGRIAQNLPS
ncbi:MAG: SDR family oxidoreductase [Burkholderiales bacterium]|nr:SDR family oxidoreductase [Burkholderiales bacterium]